MLIEKWDPFRELSDLRGEVNRLFNGSPLSRRPFDVDDGTIERPWLPPVDIFENEKTVGLRVEVPGLEKKDIAVHVENGVLSIKGEKKFESEEAGKTWRRVETRYGSFCRTFVLPETLDVEKIDAGYNQGVLTISMPRKEEALPKKVDVKIA